MEPVEIRFQYTEQEYVKAVQKYLLLSRIVKKADVIIAIIGVPCASLYLFLSSFQGISIFFLACAVLFSGFMFFLYYVAPKLTFRRTPKFREEYHLIFSEEGILFETAAVHSELKWDTFVTFMESEDCYYLVQTKQIYSVIPKRAFGKEVQKLAFEGMAKRHTVYKKV